MLSFFKCVFHPLVLMALFSHPSFPVSAALPVQQTGNKQFADKLKKTVLDLVQKTPASGILVVKKGEQLFEIPFGSANDRKNQKVQSDTLFLIASSAKNFTAAAILKLVDQQKLRLDDPVSMHFPEIPRSRFEQFGEPVRILHLLRHTSGLKEINDTPTVRGRLFRAPIGRMEIVQAIGELQFYFKPGSRFLYSNAGYVVLGEIIRRLSGQSYSQFMQKNFFDKHGLNYTFVGRPHGGSHRIAESYGSPTRNGNDRQETSARFRFRHDGEYFTDGNIYTTGRDLVRWTAMLTAGRLLSKAATKAMFTAGKTANYGLGWNITRGQDQGQVAYMHAGSFLDYSSIIEHFPEQRLTIALLLNRDLTREQKMTLFDHVMYMLRTGREP